MKRDIPNKIINACTKNRADILDRNSRFGKSGVLEQNLARITKASSSVSGVKDSVATYGYRRELLLEYAPRAQRQQLIPEGYSLILNSKGHAKLVSIDDPEYHAFQEREKQYPPKPIIKKGFNCSSRGRKPATYAWTP